MAKGMAGEENSHGICVWESGSILWICEREKSIVFFPIPNFQL